MSSISRDLEHRVQVKQELAAKYFSLAKHAKATPKKRKFLFRAEKYANQAAVLARKGQLQSS
jgi:hypothetical protein